MNVTDTTYTQYNHYYAWKKVNNEDESAKRGIDQVKTIVAGVYEPNRFLEIIRDYVYIPDKNPDKSVRRIEEKFIAYDLGKDYEGNDTYLLTMKLKKGMLAATYDEKGKLVRVVENYKNVVLPSKVIFSVYKKFPAWTIVNDKFLYTQEEGDILKKQYNIKIKKYNQVRKLVVHPDGEIVKGL